MRNAVLLSESVVPKAVTYVRNVILNSKQKKKGKREYLNNRSTKDLLAKLEIYFESTVEVPRIKIGKQQAIETLVNEEALLFAKYLRD
jgi:ABC-type uncharacterized transport system ATPase subunit